MLKENETLEDLDLDGLKIIQSKDLYRFTSDPVILANFVSASPKQKLLDIGTGSGIIAILACHKNNLKTVLGVELQGKLADMARRSIEYNNLSEKITIINEDIKNFCKTHNQEFDVITCNPPYKKQGVGQCNINQSARLARHEIALTLHELCGCVKKLLKFGGKFYVCLDADRTAELIYELKQNGLEPKKMFFTQSSETKRSSIVFVMAVSGGKEGVEVLPTLITNDKDGKYLETVRKMRF
jgi:tRNA1(Val) A37 N6-methylase TrmN6